MVIEAMHSRLKGLARECEELKKKCEALEAENARMKRQIEAYVCEFRVCRFCTEFHSDCSPTDGSCYPRWRGL